LYESPEFLSFLRREMSKYAQREREREKSRNMAGELSLFTPGAEGGSEGHAENRSETTHAQRSINIQFWRPRLAAAARSSDCKRERANGPLKGHLPLAAGERVQIGRRLAIHS
jgi:hypothetical protein